VGWCQGVLTANTDGRRVVKGKKGEKPNFWAYYEVDQEETIHLLTLDQYAPSGKGPAGSWVLLEAV